MTLRCSQPPLAPFSNTCADCSHPGGEISSVLEHVCKARPSRRRTLLRSRTRAQTAAIRVTNLAPFSNTCAKCGAPGGELGSVLEHVCKVLPFELQIRRILQPRVQSAAAGSPNSSYFKNTCAKCSRRISEFVVFPEHVRKAQPASKPD